MLPTLLPGQELWGIRRVGPVRVGHVVVARHPHDASRWLIKRVVATGPQGIDLRGDNPEASTDSRQWGAVAPRDIVYVVRRRDLRYDRE
jgi:nickel-type superoxide dismutase maturation protease